MLTRLDPAAGVSQTRPVVGEVRLGPAEAPNDRADAIVDGGQPIDDVPVVLGVAVVVGVSTGADLPVVTDADEFGVPRPELLVGGCGGVASVVGEGEGAVGLGAPIGSEDEVCAPHHRVAGADGSRGVGSTRVGDLAAQSELEEQWAGVHGEPI